MKPRFEKPPKEVSKRMKKVRSRGTKIEREMKKFLDELNLRYKEQPKMKCIRGTPDFRIKGTKILIFCDSSFWHGRRKKEVTGEAFKRNREFWTRKLKENRERDRRNTKILQREGWSVYRFWDTDILKKPDKIRNELKRISVEHKLVGFSAVDVFCGAGAITHGLIKAGIPVNAGIDNDDSCMYAFKKNNKVKFIKKDVRSLSGAFVKRLYPVKDIKILVGCAPCQPFSKYTQKNKKREKDEKWSLLYAFSDIVRKVNPHVVSMENVTHIKNHKVFTDFVETLESLKYHVFCKSVYCPDYGIPQKRRRLVLLASRLGKIEILPRIYKPSRYRTVKQAIGELEPIKEGETSKKDALHRASKLSKLNKKRIKHSKPGGTWMDWDKELRAPCHRKKTGRTYDQVYSRMEWDEPSPTITTQFYGFGTGRFGHPEQDRALSLREGAILQTFPKRYDFINPKENLSMTQIGIHIGNAVPVKLGVIIGESIIKHLEDINDRKRFQIDDKPQFAQSSRHQSLQQRSRGNF